MKLILFGLCEIKREREREREENYYWDNVKVIASDTSDTLLVNY